VPGSSPYMESAVTLDAAARLPVGRHECVTCRRCACTFAAVHPACPRCSERHRSAGEIDRLTQLLHNVEGVLDYYANTVPAGVFISRRLAQDVLGKVRTALTVKVPPEGEKS
jgi:hypothetical protein